MAQPTARGPVEIMGVTTRVCHTGNRACEACHDPIQDMATYERVARVEGNIESYHVRCFVLEFGERRLYGG